MSLNLSRQANIVNNEALTKLRVLIIGCGGIGSNAAMTLAGMGVGNFILYDHDAVAQENLATQFFRNDQAYAVTPSGVQGEFKAFALEDNIRNALGNAAAPDMIVNPEKYRAQMDAADVVIVATDNLSSRRAVWKLNRIRKWKWWIDCRMGNTTVVMFCVPGDDEDSQTRYQKAALDEWPNTTPPCGTKATSYITRGFAPGLIGLAVAQISRGERPQLYTRLYLQELANLGG